MPVPVVSVLVLGLQLQVQRQVTQFLQPRQNDLTMTKAFIVTLG